MTTLTRELKLQANLIRGLDVQGWGRAAHRYLQDGQLGAYERQPEWMQQTFGTGKRDLAKRCQAQANLPTTGIVQGAGPLMQKMTAAGAFDSLANFHIDTYAKLHTKPKLVYPLGAGWNSSVCQGLHPTAGINGSWAIDFCARGGTPVVAVEDAWIVRLSGRNPAIEPENLIGIWGWSMHYQTRQGYQYFSTHYGERTVHAGEAVKAGDLIGYVGSWPGNPGRSHSHLGVVSPYGVTDAKKRITKVAGSPRVPADV